MIKNFYDIFREIWATIFNANEEKSEIYDIPAFGWDAIYANAENGITTRPVIFWQITDYDDANPLEAVGIVFKDDKPGYIESATKSPHFIGYQRLNSESRPDSLTLAYELFKEWH